MKTLLKAVALAAVVLFSAGGDLSRETPPTFRFVPEAGAIVGLPFTPLSVAGVARRTAYRTAVIGTTAAAASAAAVAAARPPVVVVQQPAPAAAPPPAAPAGAGTPAVGTIVTTLPAGCVQTPVNNVEYQKCGQTYYRAAFQGPNLIYVVQQP